MRIAYRSIADLNNAILKNLYKFPQNIDLVVGIPRSGMLPANLISLYLNKPFTDIDSFIEGRVYSSGERGRYIPNDNSQTILIVDDSISSGNALNKAKIKTKTIENQYNIKWGVVYATKESKDKVDIYCEITPHDRIFQWNIFQHDFYLQKSFYDIDGVLCPNPPIDDDGTLYIQYITNAPLLYRPTYKIDTIISCRLEKYRAITEKWLKVNGIRYNNLIMLNLPDKKSRIKWNKHGSYKGTYYKKSDAVLFVESSLREAQEILKVSHKSVFCIETFTLMNYVESPYRARIRNLYWKIRSMLHIKSQY